MDISSHSNDVNIRKLNTIVDKLAKRGKDANDADDTEENLDGKDREEELMDPELISWARTTRQIMMDISKNFSVFVCRYH